MAKVFVVVEGLGDINGSGREMLGIYDQLSAFVHPGLGSLLFLDVRPGHSQMSTSVEEISTIAQNALGPFYTAIRRFLTYAGWEMSLLDEFEGSLRRVFPDFFSA